MKKCLTFAMLVLVIVGLLAVPGHLQANETVVTPNKLIVFKIGDLNYYTQEIGSDQVNVVKMDAAPMISNDRTFVPVRFLGNALGVDDNNIVWDNSSRTAILKGKNELKLTIGRKAITVNSQEKAIDVAPMIVDPGRTMLPARYVAEGLGFTVDWDDQNRLVVVYPEGSEKPDLQAILAKIKSQDTIQNNLPA
ncbi:MAG: copper amine oxidase N-terminal domain-containing protein, partial [Syntrophomonadaceae bacterium]